MLGHCSLIFDQYDFLRWKIGTLVFVAPSLKDYSGGERMMRPGYQQGLSMMERSLALITDSLVRAVTVLG